MFGETIKDYKPEDFSPIHYYPEVPTKKGWYVSTWEDLPLFHTGAKELSDKSGMEWWYWDGKSWYTEPYNIIASCQDRNWFGLNKESQDA